ncbi:MAG: ATP-binding cassette domain-containing protein, partial [Nitrospira sp.]|nr:ATP-binding cassette domain-containing protein [Nitrospira sp.]
MSAGQEPLISVRDLSLGYGEKVVLDRITMDIPRQGVVAVMGPSGVGKSALVRTLTRQNDNFPNFWVRGEAWIQDMNLLSCERASVEACCPLLAQKARLYAGTVLDNVIEGVSPDLLRSDDEKHEWALRAFSALGLWEKFSSVLHVPVSTLSMAKHKHILMARLLAKSPTCLFIDEPSPDIAVVEEEELLDLIELLGRRMTVVLVTHNKREAHRVCDTVCLITGGRLVEVTPKARFFSAPQTDLGREFLQSGSCWPQAPVGDGDDSVPATPPSVLPSVVKVPMLRDFYWAIPGLLGGMQQPGLLGHAGDDIATMKEMGVSVVVNLTEKPLYREELEAV